MTIPTADPLRGLVDSSELARRLGVSKATIRSWRSRGADWLPEPVGRLDGFVWREEDLVGIEEIIPAGPGRPSDSAESRRNSAARRARGAYFTPRDAAHYLASWVLRGAGETVLEPSFGDGSFIRAVADVAAARSIPRPRWVAGELDGASAKAVLSEGLIEERELRRGDFLALKPEPVDAVIANPPYVRLRHLSEPMRKRALARTATLMGAPMHPSGSVWMPFVVHMLSFLKEGGRAALVLPLDFTYVAYARPLWAHLGNNFGSLRVVRTRQRVFPDINQDVMLLLADGFGRSTGHVDYEAYETTDDLVQEQASLGGRICLEAVVSGERAFQNALLPSGLAELLEEQATLTQDASDSMTFRIGYIAGNKNYFHPDPDTIKTYKLPAASLHPALINSRRLRGLGLRTSDMDDNSADLLWVPSDELTAGEKKYVRAGEVSEVSQGYKAQMRSPWYKVPGVRAPDIILSVFSERPLLLVNDSNWLVSNSLLCGYVKQGSAEQFAANWYNPLTLLSIGLQVHSLGGGVMVMVPNEASRVRVPRALGSPETLKHANTALLAGDMRAAYASGNKPTKAAVGQDGLDLVYQGIDRLAHWRTR